jgi:hypothetical protein
MVQCAGDESRQAPAFRLHEHICDDRRLSGCESFGFGDHSLVADVPTMELPRWRTALCAGAVEPIPERGMGGASG